MKRSLITLAAAAAASALPPAIAVAAPSSAGKCGAGTSPVGHQVVPVKAPTATYYIDNRGGIFVPGSNGIWIYEETNGKGDLQRKLNNGSEAPVVGKTLNDNPATSSVETCDDLQGATSADKLYF